MHFARCGHLDILRQSNHGEWTLVVVWSRSVQATDIGAASLNRDFQAGEKTSNLKDTVQIRCDYVSCCDLMCSRNLFQNCQIKRLFSGTRIFFFAEIRVRTLLGNFIAEVRIC